MAVEIHVGMARVLAELPASITEEYGRRATASERGQSSAFRGEPNREEDVLWVLLTVARIGQYMGSEAARLAAGEVLRDTNSRLVRKAQNQGIRVPGLMFSLGQMLESMPDAVHPVAGRDLDPRVRSVVYALLRGGDEMFRDAAQLLADERPLTEESVEAVYEAHCGAVDDECGSHLSRLYSGPDDPALRGLRVRVADRVASELGRERMKRRAGCEQRSAVAGRAAIGAPSTVSGGPVRRIERKTALSTQRIGRLLEVVERIDEPAPEVLKCGLRVLGGGAG